MLALLLLPLAILVRLFAPLVVNGGKTILSGRMIGTSPSQTEPKYIGWGSASTAESASQTDLSTANAESRTAGTSSQVTTSVTSDTYQVTGTITATGSRTVQEVALFDATGSGGPPTGGNMFVRAVHGSQTLSTNDSIAYTIKVQFT